MQELYAIHQSKEAKKEIDQVGIEAKHQYAQWKKTLSGTLTDRQLSVGLSLLFFFYVFYASFNSFTEEHFQEEDLANCTCSEEHREYYQTIVIMFCSIWVTCFCLLTIWDLMRYFHVKPTNECFRWEKVLNRFVRKTEEKINEDHLDVPEVPTTSPEKQVHRPTPAAKVEAISLKPLVSPPQVKVVRPSTLKSATLERLDHYENYLWLQFNRAYSVGAALGKHKELKLPGIKSVVADEQKIQTMSTRKVSTQVNGSLEQVLTAADDGDQISKATVDGNQISTAADDGNEISKATDDGNRIPTAADDGNEISKATDDGNQISTAANDGNQIPTATDDRDGELFAHMEEEELPLRTVDMVCSSVAFILYPFLLSTRLLAQVALIPLLILQLLDTHAWICVMHDLYCDDLRSDYELGLDRTAVSFGFYCSVLVSILATTMLKWFPCSKKARKSGATSIA